MFMSAVCSGLPPQCSTFSSTDIMYLVLSWLLGVLWSQPLHQRMERASQSPHVSATSRTEWSFVVEYCGVLLLLASTASTVLLLLASTVEYCYCWLVLWSTAIAAIAEIYQYLLTGNLSFYWFRPWSTTLSDQRLYRYIRHSHQLLNAQNFIIF